MPYIDWSGNELEDTEGDTEKRDRQDWEAARLPRPGERHNASAIPVSDTVLAALLAGTRVAEVLDPCGEPDCERCNELHLIWWDCCNALNRTARVVLQSQLVAEGYGLPEAPWEDVVVVFAGMGVPEDED